MELAAAGKIHIAANSMISTVGGRAAAMVTDVNLKEWAASQGIAYVTARRQYAAGTLPIPTYRLGRLIMVGDPLAAAAPGGGQTVVYARVSSADQRSDLDR